MALPLLVEPLLGDPPVRADAGRRVTVVHDGGERPRTPRALPDTATSGVAGTPAGARSRLVGTPCSASLLASRSTSAAGSPNRASTFATSRALWLPCRSTSILARSRLAKSSRWSALSTPWAASAAFET